MLLKPVAAAAITYPTILAEPHQPKRFNFHKREFSKKSIVKRSFQAEWFPKLPWLHYREDDNTRRFLPYLCEGLQIIEDEWYY